MKALFSKPFMQKYGKKALLIYLCWCVVKGLFFMFVGIKFLG